MTFWACIFIAGFLVGLKTVLIAQFILVFILIAWVIHKSWDAVGLESILYFLFVLVPIGGVIIGDTYYYLNFYKGNNHIVDVLGWFLTP